MNILDKNTTMAMRRQAAYARIAKRNLMYELRLMSCRSEYQDRIRREARAGLEAENSALRAELAQVKADLASFQEVFSDHDRLVRELDKIMNGEDGAAKQSSLCDLVAQAETIRDELASDAEEQTRWFLVRERYREACKAYRAELATHQRALRVLAGVSINKCYTCIVHSNAGQCPSGVCTAELCIQARIAAALAEAGKEQG